MPVLQQLGGSSWTAEVLAPLANAGDPTVASGDSTPDGDVGQQAGGAEQRELPVSGIYSIPCPGRQRLRRTRTLSHSRGP